MRTANYYVTCDAPQLQVALDKDEAAAVKGLMLLTQKQMIYAANVPDTDLATGNAFVEKLRAFAADEGSRVVLVSAQVRHLRCVQFSRQR
jgi:ribosome-binding ATPase